MRCGWLVLVLASTGGTVLPAAAAEVPVAHYTDQGAEGCMRCHAGDRMAVIAETAHGDAKNPYSPYAQSGCEACHGPGSLHVSRARGGAGFPALIRFGRGGDPPAVQLDACLACHAEPMGDVPGMSWSGSLHDTGRMTCSTCHEIHTGAHPLASREAQVASCGRCHKAQIDNHKRFEAKGIDIDRLTCFDCHDPHQLVRPGG